MMNKRAPRRSDEEWHQIILASRASDLNDYEYCRNSSIPYFDFGIGSRHVQSKFICRLVIYWNVSSLRCL